MADGGRSIADIGKRLQALQLALGYNQSAFAALVGVTQSAMSNYVSGLRRPDIDVAIRIQLKTGVSLDWIYLGDRSGLPARLLAALPDLSETERRA